MKKLIPQKKEIDHQRFVDLMKGCWMLNDIQLNWFDELKNILDAGGFYVRNIKSRMESILKDLRGTEFNRLWKSLPDEEDMWEMTGEWQDKAEEVVAKCLQMLSGLRNRIIVWCYTDYGIGDTVWIRRKGSDISVRIVGARCVTDITAIEGASAGHNSIHEFAVKVVALNSDGKPYGDPFWVKDEHIALHRKELKTSIDTED